MLDHEPLQILLKLIGFPAPLLLNIISLLSRGGGVTILKGEGLRKKYKGTDEGGIELSTRKGTLNPFKRLKDALQSLKPQPKKYANPRFL